MNLRDEEKQKLDNFLTDLSLLGSLQGFRYFQPWLRGREEILLTVVNEDLSCPPPPSPGSVSSEISYHLPTCSSDQSTPRGSGLLPPASPCDREIAIPETHCTLFLLAAYAKYGRPYVWVRSNHERFTGTELCDKDSPLMLPSYSQWDSKDVGVWHIVWDVVSACVSPPPRNPLAVDFVYLKSLPLPERSLSSGALVSFFHSLLLREPRGTPLFSYVWEELADLTRLHAHTLQDLKEQNLIKNLI
ncbi:uncharacterized protein LOC122929355 isoform X1 [Bufo gargarizans]|uniref:uncharacterized protein LOC122929355 isoform X1 n=1 Tax=Bufo gargarizans TaxID=30331 RepID=UPI001CF4CE9D|nr:uncharacterized protein LOC122929355 isoform X1 [Bufo gargarizans]